MIANPTEFLRNVKDCLPWLATLAALGAFWVSWREVRRNNKVLVKLKKFSSHQTHTAGGCASELEVWVVNRGIQMQNISMSLSFDGPGKSGYFRVPIRLPEPSISSASTFLRGTTAKFVLSSTDKDSELLGILRDFSEQKPTIELCNSSFLVCSFAIYSRWDWLKRYWNKLNSRFIFNRRVGEGVEGKGVFKMYHLPFFAIRSDNLRFFLTGVKQSEENGQSGCR